MVLTGEGADELFAGYDRYRSCPTPRALRASLTASVRALYNTNLQRADRMGMSHGIEARVPFLDVDVVSFALGLPSAWIEPDAGGQEKQLLRNAFAGLLPSFILHRKKAKFSEGAGSVHVLERYAERQLSDRAFVKIREGASMPITTKEEAMYYQIYTEHFGPPRTKDEVGRTVLR